MTRNRPPSPQAQALMFALAMRPEDWRYGYDLMKATDLKSGTLYPALIRLEEKGLLESQWGEHQQDGRPPRHMYRLTDAGLKCAHELDAARPASANTLRKQPA
jgi:PadR family transcriptional regulator, regulatory protein PadR